MSLSPIIASFLEAKTAAFLSDKWFKAQKAKLKAILAKPVRERPEHWSYELQDALQFFKDFQTEFEQVVQQEQARISVRDRVSTARDYIESFISKTPTEPADLRNVDFRDPKSYLKWYGYLDIVSDMKESAETVGGILKYEWSIDIPALDKLVAKTLKSATPAETAALTQDSHDLDLKYGFLARVGFEKAAKRCWKRSKLSWDPLKWLDQVYATLAGNYSESAINEAKAGFREFDLHGMKVIVDDSTVMADDVAKYVKYLDKAYNLLASKGFKSAWYGNVFIECHACGGVNYNDGGGTGGWYEIGRDTVTIFNRPGAFIVELMVHELGHRYWFKQMGSSQRAKFEALVKTHTKPRPLKPTVNVRMFKDKDIDDSKRQVLRAQERAEQRLARVVNYDLANLTSLARDNVGKDGWAFGGDILDAVTSLDVDKDLGSEVDRLKDDVYKTKTKLVEHFEDFTLLRPEGKDDWLAEARQLIDQVVSEALIFIDFAVQKHNERAKEKLKSDPAMLEWLDSYKNNPAPVPAVSDYGKSNIDEAFAEVFAHYVLEYDITRDQVESFKSVLKTASLTSAIENFVRTAAIGDPKDILREFESALIRFTLPAAEVDRAKTTLEALKDNFLGNGSEEWKAASSVALHAKDPYADRWNVIQDPGNRLFLSILQTYALPPAIRKKVEVASRSYQKVPRPRIMGRTLPQKFLEYILLYEKFMGEWQQHLQLAKDAIASGAAHSDNGEAATKLAVGPFTLINTGGFDADVMANVSSIVEKATHLMQKAGFGKVCYGDIQVTNTLSRANVLAFYKISSDDMFIRANIKGNYDSLQTVLHEFGHRLGFKLLHNDKAISTLYRRMDVSLSSDGPEPAIGDTITSKGRTYKVTGLSWKSSGKIVLLEDEAGGKASVGLMSFNRIKDPTTISPVGFVTPYAKSDKDENFAEMFAFYCLGKLSADQEKHFLEAVGRA